MSAPQFQPHGAVLIVDAKGAVVGATSGCGAVLGRDAGAALGRPLEEILGGVTLDDLRPVGSSERVMAWRRLPSPEKDAVVKARVFELPDGLSGVDVLPAARVPGSDSAAVERIASWSERLHGSTSEQQLLSRACEAVASLSGFSEVRAYRIGDGVPGAGIVEAVWPALQRVSGPVDAADIPPGDPKIRKRPIPFFVADINADPVELVTSIDQRELDVSASALHRPYADYLDHLGQRGICATLSIPLEVGAGVWGRIVAHHGEPRGVPASTQAELALVGIAAGARLAELIERRLIAAQARSAAWSTRLIRSVAASGDFRTGLVQDPHALLALCDATTCLLSFDGRLDAVGEAVAETTRLAVFRHARRQFNADPSSQVVTATRVPDLADIVGGYLAVRLDESATHLVIWMRSIAAADEPWTPAQLDGVHQFRDALASLLMSRYHRLQQRNTDLERSNDEFGAFAHAAAHDLRGPTRGIGLEAEFLLEDDAENLRPGQAESLRTVLRLSRHMRGLLDDLMSYAEIGETAMDPQPLALRDATREVLELVDPDLVVSARIDTADATIVADPSALRQLLVNLIGNACKYSSSDPRIEVGVTTLDVAAESAPPPSRVAGLGGDQPVVFVADHGIGLAPERHEEVFGLFTRFGTGAEVGGNGAGLALCRRIAQRHGGDVWLTSALGEGTTVFAVFGEVTEEAKRHAG